MIVCAINRKQIMLELKTSENYYRAIFDNRGAAVAIIDENMRITLANKECEKLLGYSIPDLCGVNITKFIHRNDLDKVIKYHQSWRINNDKTSQYQYQIRLINTQKKVVEALITEALIPGTKNSVLNIADISELQRVTRARQILSNCNMAVVHAEDEKSLLDTVCTNIVKLGGYKFAWIGYTDASGDIVLQTCVGSGVDERYIQNLKEYNAETFIPECMIFEALNTSGPVICRNLAVECKHMFYQEYFAEFKFNSHIALPLLADSEGKPIGIIHIIAGDDDCFDEKEVNLLKEMAGDLAYGIAHFRTRVERDKALDRLKQSLNKQQQILRQTVGALSAAMENRDPYTAEHQRRVADLACAIAREMKYSEDRIHCIDVAGTLHDIGKSIIPSEILTRPGHLSNLEFDLIKTHSQLGYEIIKDIEFPWPVAEIILQHHEKLDGSGYPNGLIGDDILIEVRILTVADVIEAMASHRPYRPALGIDIALEEINQQRGIFYDADVVDACIRLFEEKEYKMKPN